MRAASFTLAVAASVIGVVFPFLLARHATGLNQSVLLLMMAGIMGAFIHGAGFRPASKAAQMATDPWLTWPLIAAACAFLVLSR